MFSKKGVLENFANLRKKDLFPIPARVFYCQFYEIFENTFLQNTTGRLLLMKKLDGQNFNSVSLIFIDSELYHAPPE